MHILNRISLKVGDPFITSEIASKANVSLRTAQRYVKEWLNEGLVSEAGTSSQDGSYYPLYEVVKLPLDLVLDEPVSPEKADPMELVKADLALTREIDKRKDVEAKYKAAKLEIAALTDVVGDMLTLSETDIPTTVIEKRTTSDDEVIPLLMVSDWHCGEVVDGNTIKGLNEYNPDLAESRIHAVFRNAMYLIDKVRKGGNPVKSLAVWLGGDLINGWIHDEYLATNAMTPMEELLFAYRVLIDLINFLLNVGDFEIIEFFCNGGNHGRSTKKKMIGAQAVTSYEWMFYHLLKTHFKDEPRVKFTIADGYMLDAKIMDVDLCFHHGEAIRGGGGVGGIAVPLQRGIMKWNEVEPLKPNAFHILGHFHQLLTNMRSFFMNGSIIGYNDYALEKQCGYEDPQQGMCLIVPGQRVPCEFKRIWTEVTHG